MHVALEELHEPSLPQHREGILDEVHTIQSAISLLSQREYDDLQTRAHDFVGARQIANPDGLRGRVLRTRGGGPHYRKPSDRVVIIVIPFGDVGDVCGMCRVNYVQRDRNNSISMEQKYTWLDNNIRDLMVEHLSGDDGTHVPGQFTIQLVAVRAAYVKLL